IVRNLLGCQPQATRISHTQGLAATHDSHGFEALVAHDSTTAVLTRHMPVVAVDGGKAYLIFASDTAGIDAEPVAGEVERLLQSLLRLPGVFAEESTGIAEFHGVVVDIEIHPARGPPLEHNGVIPGVF